MGSVIVGAHYTANLSGEQTNLWGGLKLAVPTSLMSDDRVTRAVGDTVGSLRGDTEAHRFGDGAVGIRPEFGVEWRNRAEWLYLRASLAPTILAPAAEHAEVDVTLDQHSEIEARAHFGLGGGFALRETVLFTARERVSLSAFGRLRDDDPIQTSIEPFVGYESPETGLLARFGLLVSLDSRSTEISRPRLVVPRLQLGAVW